jgi:hypothetical protein
MSWTETTNAFKLFCLSMSDWMYRLNINAHFVSLGEGFSQDIVRLDISF